MGESGGRLKALGPGLLFAAVSVGVSHLVQATRAGAGFGLSLLWVVVLALILKWPLFEFGQRYAAATGTSLLEGYRKQGRWSLVLYLLLTMGTMFTVLAAVAAVTAGMAVQLTGLAFESSRATLLAWSGGLIALAGAVLVVGRYPLLDKAIKVIMAVLGVSALIAFVMAIPSLGEVEIWGTVDWSSIATVTFVVALVGWMPTGFEVCVWQSFWSLARRRQTGHTPTLKETLFDFRFGYIGTGILAVIFIALGAAVMFNRGVEFSNNPIAFGGQVIDLFTKQLGEQTRIFITVAAFTTMFSTTLTVLDGFPRALALLMRRFRTEETPEELTHKVARSPAYWLWMTILAIGAMLIVGFYMKGLKGLIDLATILSFAVAPFLGILTFRAILHPSVPGEYRPGSFLKALAVVSICFLGAFFLFFLYYRFIRGSA